MNTKITFGIVIGFMIGALLVAAFPHQVQDFRLARFANNATLYANYDWQFNTTANKTIQKWEIYPTFEGNVPTKMKISFYDDDHIDIQASNGITVNGKRVCVHGESCS